MKIALVHDYLKEFGGAERVLETLHNIWPEAPVYTAFVDWEGLGHHAKRIKNWDIKTSCVQKLWLVRKFHSPLRFLTPLIWESFNFDEYDLVITSSAWYIPRGIITRPETTHLCYLHTPPRHLYGYETGSDWKKYFPVRIYSYLVNFFLRIYDFLTAQRVDYFIANSQETQRRIKKFYRRDSIVIYPPVNIKNSPVEINRQSRSIPQYYLCVSRLAKAKHIDLAISACNQLKKQLVIVGKGKEDKFLRSIAGPTIKFLGEVEDEALLKIYAKAKALIFPAVDEEFGIVPVEAMSQGVPVIAYRSGGLKETVVEGKTGVFFDQLSVEDLIKAMQRLDKQGLWKNNNKIKLINHVQKFSQERFIKEIVQFVKGLT